MLEIKSRVKWTGRIIKYEAVLTKMKKKRECGAVLKLDEVRRD